MAKYVKPGDGITARGWNALISAIDRVTPVASQSGGVTVLPGGASTANRNLVSMWMDNFGAGTNVISAKNNTGVDIDAFSAVEITGVTLPSLNVDIVRPTADNATAVGVTWRPIVTGTLGPISLAGAVICRCTGTPAVGDLLATKASSYDFQVYSTGPLSVLGLLDTVDFMPVFSGKKLVLANLNSGAGAGIATLFVARLTGSSSGAAYPFVEAELDGSNVWVKKTGGRSGNAYHHNITFAAPINKIVMIIANNGKYALMPTWAQLES